MTKSRLEAFSDGVIAILITIMVLELRPPHGSGIDDLGPLVPTFLSYMLSFGVLGIYWNNHHHLLHAAKAVDGWVLWANLNLLFWLSMFPFATAWIGERHFASVPVAGYGVVMLLAAIAYYILVRALIAVPGQPRAIAEAIGRDVKGKISPALSALGIPVGLVAPAVSMALYAAVVLLWVVPDRRMERAVRS
jgi:uncharacterized membrane protein